jgi:hypothetical protein
VPVGLAPHELQLQLELRELLLEQLRQLRAQHRLELLHLRLVVPVRLLRVELQLQLELRELLLEQFRELRAELSGLGAVMHRCFVGLATLGVFTSLSQASSADTPIQAAVSAGVECFQKCGETGAVANATLFWARRVLAAGGGIEYTNTAGYRRSDTFTIGLASFRDYSASCSQNAVAFGQLSAGLDVNIWNDFYLGGAIAATKQLHGRNCSPEEDNRQTGWPSAGGYF